MFVFAALAFINRRKARLKILYFDGAVLVSASSIWSKGKFTFAQLFDCMQLKLLLGGLEMKKVRQYMRFSVTASS